MTRKCCGKVKEQMVGKTVKHKKLFVGKRSLKIGHFETKKWLKAMRFQGRKDHPRQLF